MTQFRVCRISRTRFLIVPIAASLIAVTAVLAITARAQADGELLTTNAEIGRAGGGLIVAQRIEPKTLNPVMALDIPSREVIWRMMADLVHINRQSQQTEPALAKAWKISSDGRRYTLTLRRGIRFSDGHPFDADDVVFSFQVYMDAKVGSPQRDLLLPGGKPIVVHKIDPYTVEFQLPQPYGPAERLFDSIAMLPRHILEKNYKEGTFPETWQLNSRPEQIVGLGPFRLKEYVPGARVVLERNPYYWKSDRAGERLPYLERITFLFVGTDDAQVMRFQAGETDTINRISPDNYSALVKSQNGKYRLNGKPVENLDFSERSRIRNQEIGFIFQSFNLIGDLTVYENVELPLTYRQRMTGAERKQRVMEALERVGMAHRLRHYPSQLSGGQQQRVAVARALAGKPSILLADEPTGNLDSRNGEAVMQLLQDLHKEGATICMVTHDPRFAKHADREVHLFDGKVVGEEELRRLVQEVY